MLPRISCREYISRLYRPSLVRSVISVTFPQNSTLLLHHCRLTHNFPRILVFEGGTY
jgi:hypothetical protein